MIFINKICHFAWAQFMVLPNYYYSKNHGSLVTITNAIIVKGNDLRIGRLLQRWPMNICGWISSSVCSVKMPTMCMKSPVSAKHRK